MYIVARITVQYSDPFFKVIHLPESLLQKGLVIENILDGSHLESWIVSLIVYDERRQIITLYLDLWDWDGVVNYKQDELDAMCEFASTNWFGSDADALLHTMGVR